MMPKQRDRLLEAGDYVHNNYHDLLRYGLGKDDAKMIYDEGSKLALYYDIRVKQLSVSKDELNQIQLETKQAYTSKQQRAVEPVIKVVSPV